MTQDDVREGGRPKPGYIIWVFSTYDGKPFKREGGAV